MHEGGLPPLLELLHHTDDHIVEQALVTLRNISVNVENEVKIVAAGALTPLITLLRSPKPSIQEQACGTLRNFCEHRE